MLTTSSRDSWERLVAAVLKRDQIWQLCHQDSITTISSDSSQPLLSSSSNSLIHVSTSSPNQLPLIINNSIVQDKKNASATITQKLFSAMLWRRKPNGKEEDNSGCKSFSLLELCDATDNFSDKNILGRGGHGTVYKGRLGDGSVVAIKRFRAQRYEAMIEKELVISSLVAHCNVIRLRGFCITPMERFIVCPYMANGSVASWLRDRADSEPPIHWEWRKRIALGVAEGLAYLHHECSRGVIHRDIKASNILLDDSFRAVVADFSLGRFIDCYDDVDSYDGTVGHTAPEYHSTGECSYKIDVYGYGIFLLELITAQRAYDLARFANYEDVMLLNWVKNLFERKTIEVMVDKDLGDEYVEEEVEKLLQIALICTQTDPEIRPAMTEVVRMLLNGDGLAERWRDFSPYVYENEYYAVEEVYPDPGEWIIDSSDVSGDELSGPR